MSGVCIVSTCTCICLVCGGRHDVIICRGAGIVHNAVIIIIMKMHPLLSFVLALILTVISVVTRAMNVLFAS